MNKNQEKKDILNYVSDYGKDLHEKTLMEDTRKKKIKKYEKDHERKDSKERTNIYVENLNIDKFDNSNYGNNINPTVQGNLDLNMDWSIKSSEPLYNNNGLELPKSNYHLSEEEIKNSKMYKDMENNYKEALKERNKEIEGLRKDLIEANAKIKKLKKFISEFIDFVLLFIKDKDDKKKITAVMKMYMEDDDNE